MKIFVDSDVIISSLISSKGAAYFLLHQTALDFYISNISLQELEIVIERLKLDKKKLHKLIKDKRQILQLKEAQELLREQYMKFVVDPYDAHIVAAAKKGKVKFLISYNVRHFKRDIIKQELDIIVTTPGNILQYLRSL